MGTEGSSTTNGLHDVLTHKIIAWNCQPRNILHKKVLIREVH